MAEPTPPVFEQALEHLTATARQHRVADFDPLTSPFAALQPVLEQTPDNGVLLGLSSMFGARAARTHGAFWFPQREAPLGAALGLPTTLIAITPLELVRHAVAQANLGELDRREAELRDSLAAVPVDPASPERLGPADYRALFDPGFVQFLVLDPRRVEAALALPASRATQLLEAAIAGAGLAPHVAEAVARVWAKPLGAQGATPLAECARREARGVESFVRLYAGVAAGGAADESFWADVIFPLARGVGGAAPAGALGVFAEATTRAAVAPLGDRARIYAVDAAELPPRLELTGAPEALAPTLVEIARDRLGELERLRRRVAAPLTLALRRLTEAEVGYETAAGAVGTALQR